MFAEWPVVGSDKKDPLLLSKQYYHGFFPRDEVCEVLEEVGDFLIRTSLSTSKAQHGLVLSAMLVEEKKGKTSKKVRHFPIDHDLIKGFKIEDGPFFKSVVDMVESYLKSGKSISETHNCILLKPIPRGAWQLLHKDIRLVKKLTGWMYGEVYSGELRCANGTVEKVAIKQSKLEDGDRHHIKAVLNEAKLMRAMHHPNVVKLFGVAATQDPLLVVLELAGEGALVDILHKKKTPLLKKAEYTTQASWGIEYIHSVNVTHRDIAARNCLINKGVLKISDFGLSRLVSEPELGHNSKIPIKWMAPEVLATGKYSTKCDVWSFGVLCWEIFADGATPYEGFTPMEVREIIQSGRSELSFPSETPTQIVALVKESCWTSHSKRADMHQVSLKLEKVTHLKRPVVPSSTSLQTAKTNDLCALLKSLSFGPTDGDEEAQKLAQLTLAKDGGHHKPSPSQGSAKAPKKPNKLQTISEGDEMNPRLRKVKTSAHRKEKV